MIEEVENKTNENAQGKQLSTDIEGTAYGILDKISYPSDLRELPLEQLPEVCEQIRRVIINTCSHNPGHFASSMGAVELTVALHYVYNTPLDNLVWDVGHQAYAHKILTGRKDRFSTLRKKGGLSGFPTPRESEYDTFTAGHASNSISVALGMAAASHLSPQEQPRHTVAIIGDASISGGLAFEGLNNAANSNNDILIVLNDNDMSIDQNVGSLHRYLSRLTTSSRYNRMRRNAYRFLKRHKLMRENSKGRFTRFSNSLKSLISRRQNIFEGLNIRYFGPMDGNNVIELVRILREIKQIEGPRLLHITTVKGKGFKAAEENPAAWHAPGKFNAETGEKQKSKSANTKWQDAMADTLCQLAEQHPEIVGITAAMPSGTSMNKMQQKYPDRTFDVGISEGHAVTFAGGLAAAGKHPFVAIYSSFLQRAYDNIIHDVAISSLPVTFCIDRAGLVGEDGITHHGLFDLAYLSVIPGLSIASPMDIPTLQDLMLTSLSMSAPLAIRYPRGNAPSTDETDHKMSVISVGKGRCLANGQPGSVAILSLGPIGIKAQEAVKLLNEKGISVAHYDMIWLKPLDSSIISEVAATASHIVTLEDASVKGGLGSAVLEWLSDNNCNVPVTRLGIPAESWMPHATVDEQYQSAGIDVASLVRTIEKLSENKSIKS